jgi:hypothetical protein
MNLDPRAFVDQLINTLAQDGPIGWREQHLEQWRSHRDTIAEVLATDHPLHTLAKAARITFLEQNVLQDVRIVTDLRPVFDASAGSIARGVIVNHLILDYFEGGRMHTLSLAIDVDDVDRLSRISDRARKKISLLRSVMKIHTWPTYVAGDEIDDDSD